MNLLKRTAAIFIIFTLLSSSLVFAQQEDNLDKQKYFDNVVKYINEQYNYEVDNSELYKNAINKVLENHPEVLESVIEGMFDSLDNYSTFFPEEEFDSFSHNVSGKYEGVGVVITSKEDYITVVSTFDESPAYKAGIKTGDKILYINDIDVTGYAIDKAAMLMKGEPGTQVGLTILRGDKELTFSLSRDVIKISPVYSEIIENSIGYIRITSFNSNASEFMKKALQEVNEQEISKIIVDLRNNPGGSIDEALEVASCFVPKGETIINIKRKDEDFNPVTSNGPEENKYELVVLINEGSASASEIFAAAIKDNEVGKLVGVKTFGKGTIQKVLPLMIGGGIKMTIAEFYTPFEERINEEGISPNITIKNVTQKVNDDELEHLTVEDKYSVGDESKNIYAAEQRLSLLGYDVGEPDKYYDDNTFEAVREFQENNDLYPYGVLDFTTQSKIKDVINTLEYTIDKQLEKAIELLK